MQYLPLLALAGAATAQGFSKGFNYGNVFTDGSPKEQSDFEAEFSRAQSLPNAEGFTSARLYTMIQGGTTNTPISAIQAAIDTNTSLLLGLWASASSEVFQNELDALSASIEQYGSALTDLIVGISVGSEDLYRVSVQGVANEAGLGEGPDVLVDYIQRTRAVIEGTAASDASIGHVDTWNDWVNGSNSAVLDAVDWIGFNAFPYFENTLDNNVENGNSLFQNALSNVRGVAGDKPIWITEAGWPVSGSTENQAVASVENSKTYWDTLGCAELFDNFNVWWYILRDNNASPAPNPSFGIVGIELEEPLFDLSCPSSSSSATSASGSATPIATAPAASNTNADVEVTSDRVNVTAPQSTNNTEQTVSNPPAVFDLDIDSIMQSLPDLIVSNPAIVQSLPTLIASNPELAQRAQGLNLTEMAAKHNLAPVYVQMLKSALDDAAKNAGYSQHSAANATSSSNATEPPNSADALFKGNDVSKIMESLPNFVSNNPSMAKKLPDMLASNPALLERVQSLNLTDMAAKHNVAPVYVDMMKNAVDECKKGDKKDGKPWESSNGRNLGGARSKLDKIIDKHQK